MYEILLTRIFSVTMIYHFAFVGLSATSAAIEHGPTLEADGETRSAKPATVVSKTPVRGR
jgi:hypothetical protein